MEIAKSGKLGLDKYRNFLAKKLLFHIIFIDIEMPDMDGLEVTRLLRATENEFNLKRSFICGLITEENNQFDIYHEQGMDEFLKKPVNVQVLNEMIERRLQQIEKDSEIIPKIPEIQPIFNGNEKNVENIIEKQEKPENLLDFEIVQPMKLREKVTFLTIDDNDFILIGISHLKLECEYKMDICKSGSTGLIKYKDFLKNQEKYHAIFLDIDMPGMTGLDVAHEIRKIETHYNLPHTFICGLITEDNKDFDAYIEAGMNDLLKKPVNPKSMNLILQKILPPKQEDIIKSSVPMPLLNEKNIEESKSSINNIDPQKNNDNILEIKLQFKPEITFLAVDDNDFILLGISHLKLDFKYKMDICKNGLLALEKYKAMRAAGFLYHTIFMDIDMPQMDGLQCAIKIRELEKKQILTTHIIGLINDDYKDVEKYLEAGMNEFLNKPVNPKSMNLIMKKRLEDVQKIQQELIEKKALPMEKFEEKKSVNIPKKEIKCKEECTLLAVDDNDFILMGISHLRVDIKYKMDVCKNGKLALEKYYKMLDSYSLYHMIFMDIEMPEMNGLECTKKIRDFEKVQNIPKTQIIG